MTANDLFQIKAKNEIRKLEIQIQCLETLQHNNLKFIEEYLEQEKRQLFKEYNITPNFIAQDLFNEQSAIMVAINDYESISIDSREVLSQYLIVACYSFFEKSLKRILKLTGKVEEKNLKKIYQINHMIIELSKLDVDFKKLNEANKLLELRALNNIIKHSGIINEELANMNNIWIARSTLGDLTGSFKDLKNSPIKLIKDLTQKINIQ